MGHLFVFLTICSRKISITLLFVFHHPPSLPLALPAPYLVSIALIFTSQPPLLKKRQQSWSSMKRASHVESECTSCASTSKAAVLACSSASPQTLRMLGCKAFRRFESKWNIKLTSIFILFEIRNDLPSPGWGYLSRCGGVLVFLFCFLSAWLHCRLKCVHTVPPCGGRRHSHPLTNHPLKPSDMPPFKKHENFPPCTHLIWE